MLPTRLLPGILSLLLVFASTVLADVVDRCVAVVNDDIITLSEVNELGKPLFQRVAEEVSSDQLAEALRQARETVINKLIEKKLLAQEAEKLHIKVTDKEVEQALARILERNHTSREVFKKELAAMGMDEQRYKEDLRDQILGSKVINYEVRSKIIIPEEKIIDYYDTHYTEQVGEGGYYILQIGISWDKEGTTREEARQKAERIRSLAVNGKDFKELARKYSDLPSSVDGGDIGVFRKDEMAGYMRKAVTALKPGQVSEVVETPVGYQIFKLLSSQEGQIITKVPYKDVKEEIRATLYQQEMQELYKNWMKRMREQAYIKIL
ncbi:MAG TPA: peptidylprolyl isomerase [Desulfobulbus sp.]|nr:peptidylprolyl isomerase [Desulfobulbus sp.]